MEIRNSKYVAEILSSLGIASCRMNVGDWLNYSSLSLLLVYYFQLTDEGIARDVSRSISICITEYLQTKQLIDLNCNNHSDPTTGISINGNLRYRNNPSNYISSRSRNSNLGTPFSDMDARTAFYLSNMHCNDCIVKHESFMTSLSDLLYGSWNFSIEYQSIFTNNILNTNAGSFLSNNTQPQQLNIDEWILSQEFLNSIRDIDHDRYQQLKQQVKQQCSGDCPISLENISIAAIPDCCWNDFEKEYLCEWLINNYNTCPLCRRRIRNIITINYN